jgi:hypothetical protein
MCICMAQVFIRQATNFERVSIRTQMLGRWIVIFLICMHKDKDVVHLTCQFVIRICIEYVSICRDNELGHITLQVRTCVCVNSVIQQKSSQFEVSIHRETGTWHWVGRQTTNSEYASVRKQMLLYYIELNCADVSVWTHVFSLQAANLEWTSMRTRLFAE